MKISPRKRLVNQDKEQTVEKVISYKTSLSPYKYISLGLPISGERNNILVMGSRVIIRVIRDSFFYFFPFKKLLPLINSELSLRWYGGCR